MVVFLTFNLGEAIAVDFSRARSNVGENPIRNQLSQRFHRSYVRTFRVGTVNRPCIAVIMAEYFIITSSVE